MTNLIWENLDDYTSRTKVLGGWIVKTIEDAHVSLHEDMKPQVGYEWRLSTCFVPDANHEWKM